MNERAVTVTATHYSATAAFTRCHKTR